MIRRRRVCLTCNFRFTTFERVQLRELVVIKRNGRCVPFDRDKLLRSVQIALRKRRFEPERIDQVVSKMVRELESQGESEVSSETVGQTAMETLRSARRCRRMRASPRCIGISAKPRISRRCSTNCRARRTRRQRRGSELAFVIMPRGSRTKRILPMAFELRFNGRARAVDAADDTPLLWVLRAISVSPAPVRMRDRPMRRLHRLF